MTITIRKASKSDIPAIFALVQEIKQTHSHAPKLTLEDLYKDGGFEGGPACFFAFVAEDTEIVDSYGLSAIIGFIMASYMYSWDGRAIFMNQIYVSETHRSKGVGKSLFNKLLKHAKQTRCGRMEFNVLHTDPALKFYEKMGAINTSEKAGYHFYRVCKDVINSIGQ